ncbi:MAG: carboxypeptidase-like regulatory domain-containing protein [Flavobacteriales bacterium]|nr:carboxypeptidase-like regulatory domain-containing protein [Flavobacteriales bacterium]
MKPQLTNFSIGILLSATLLSYGCSEDDESNPEGINLTGTVNLYTENGMAVSDSGMTVTINSTSTQAITDSDGNFTFSNLEFGNYLMVFSKDGFGEHKRSINHPQSDTPNFLNEFINLGQISTAEMSSLDVSLNVDFLTISAVSNPQATVSTPRYFHIFFHNQPDVSHTEFTTFETREFSISPSNYNKSVNFFYDSGFESGDEVFIAVYTTSKYDNSYFDSGAGMTVFPNINTETVEPVSFVLP